MRLRTLISVTLLQEVFIEKIEQVYANIGACAIP